MDAASPSRHYPSPHSEDRVRRNVACINCRNSKVRCRASQVSGQPCQRCAKLELSCVVDKSHKRITKRSKLEQLEQELKSIKQAVSSTPRGSNVEAEPRPPRSPRGSYAGYATDSRPTLSHGPLPAARDTPLSLCASAGAGPSSASASAPDSITPRRPPPKTTPTRPRTLGTKVVSAADIDHYFDKFLTHFHPLVPLLRRTDPDDCYEACPTLFWTVLYVAARRYARHADDSDPDHLVPLLIETLTRDVWTLPGTPLVRLEEVHAMLLVCAYPLPGTRLVTDPSTMLASVCVAACMMLGLHTGRGAHGEFCVGSRQSVSCSDDEAARTWMVACVLSQRCAVGIGHPTSSVIQLDDAGVQRGLDPASPLTAGLLAMFDAQKYLQRMHAAMAMHISASGCVPESVVSSWEDELEALRPVLGRHDTDATRFMLLAAQLEVQTYYFMQSPDPPPPPPAAAASAAAAPPPLPPAPASSPPSSVSPPASGPTSTTPSVNVLRAIRTAARLICFIVTPSPLQFLTHSPHWITRCIIDATALLTSALHSHLAPSITASLLPLLLETDGSEDESKKDSNNDSSSSISLLVQRAHTAMTACSVRDMDLPARGAAIIEAFWSNRERMARSDCAARAWPSRLSAGTTFWCLSRFNQSLRQAKIQCRGLYKGPVPPIQIHSHRTQEGAAGGGEDTQMSQPVAQSENTPGATDPFQEVDWSLFLDDFGWGGDEPIFMGLS